LKGEVAEFGVATGNFARFINTFFPNKKLYLFDSFDGFKKDEIDAERANNLSSPEYSFYKNIDVNKVLSRMKYQDNCVIRKGYFPETTKGLPEDLTFCFVSLDCDLYQSMLDGLNYFYPRLNAGGYIMVHDYSSKYYRGVKKALQEFSKANSLNYVVLPDNTGSAVLAKPLTN